jgi:hypothetical protein
MGRSLALHDNHSTGQAKEHRTYSSQDGRTGKEVAASPEAAAAQKKKE